MVPEKILEVNFFGNVTDLTISFNNSCHSFRGAWSSRVNDRYQWLQVSFRYPKKIVAIATQGRQDWNQWVISYRLTYSMDKIHYVYYKQLGVTKVCYRSVSVNRWFSLYREYSLPRRIWSLYPHHSNISMHILHTVLYTFPKVLTRRICLTIHSFFRWWSLFFFILMSLVIDSGVIPCGDISRSSKTNEEKV